MQDAFWGSERESTSFLLLNQEENPNLASQVKGKAGEEDSSNYFLAGSPCDQSKIPFYAGIEELNTFTF